MKIFMLMVAALVIMVGASQVVAEEVSQTTKQQIQIQVIEIKPYDSTQLVPANYPNGVFVVAKRAWTEYPRVASIFAEKLRANGFMIAATKETADAVFRFGSADLPFKEIEENVETIAARKIDGVAGAAITAVATGGLSLLVTDFSFLGNEKPRYVAFGVKITNRKTNDSINPYLTGLIKANADNVEVTKRFFDIMTNEWLKANVQNAAHEDVLSVAQPEQTSADEASSSTKQ